MSYTPRMSATRSVTLRIPVDLYDSISREATNTRASVSQVIITRLAPAGTANPTTTPQTTGMTVPSPAPKTADVVPIKAGSHSSTSSEGTKSERDTRHLSPQAAPVRTLPATGYQIAEADCAHPKSAWKVYSYMTRCTDCGRRLR